MLVLLCKIKDNLTRNLRKKKIIKKIEVNFLILVEQKVRAIFVLFCFRNKLSWKSFLYGVFWNLMVLFLKFWGIPYVLDGCVLGFEINSKILACEVFNLYFVLQIDSSGSLYENLIPIFHPTNLHRHKSLYSASMRLSPLVWDFLQSNLAQI